MFNRLYTCFNYASHGVDVEHSSSVDWTMQLLKKMSNAKVNDVVWTGHPGPWKIGGWTVVGVDSTLVARGKALEKMNFYVYLA